MDLQKTDFSVKMQTFYEAITEENKKFNITAITDKEDFYIKNVYDCVYGAEIYDKGASVVEIGSGGGFPSVPIKAEREDLRFTLVESNAKKCGFLCAVKEKLGFENFNVVCGRAEELSLKKEYREKFDFAIARAVAPANILCELLIPFLKVGGRAVLYKGKNYKEELKSAETAISVLHAETERVIEYTLDKGLGERAIVIIKKIKSTDEAYPRKYAKIKKQPL